MTPEEKALVERCKKETTDMFRKAMWGDDDFEIVNMNAYHWEVTADYESCEIAVDVEQWEKTIRFVVGLDEDGMLSLMVGEDYFVGSSEAAVWMVLAAELSMIMDEKARNTA